MNVTVWVKPGARSGASVTASEHPDQYDLIVRVPERPVDGAANEAVVRLLAEHFGVRRADVAVVSGTSARLKRIRIRE